MKEKKKTHRRFVNQNSGTSKCDEKNRDKCEMEMEKEGHVKNVCGAGICFNEIRQTTEHIIT